MTATWPDGVVGRYLTTAGVSLCDPTITVDISLLPSRSEDAAAARCTGCTETREFDTYYGTDRNTQDARKWAQAHAETCRAIPNPNA